jgi:hypothetical protein
MEGTTTGRVLVRNPAAARAYGDKKTRCPGKLDVRENLMSQRIDKSWLVSVSVENTEHDRCVDIFSRPDGSYGFEEFRRDVEDGGQWTPVHYYSGAVHASAAEALNTAERCVPWLTDILRQRPELRARIAGSRP